MYSYSTFLNRQYSSVLNSWIGFNLSVSYQDLEKEARSILREEFPKVQKALVRPVPSLSPKAERILDIFEQRFATIFYNYSGRAGLA